MEKSGYFSVFWNKIFRRMGIEFFFLCIFKTDFCRKNIPARHLHPLFFQGVPRLRRVGLSAPIAFGNFRFYP
ncbi:hypothetical protein IZU27_10135 [Treponema socranskii]|uniref:hypothetical protein n=1 Tax=Treponema socranskii TaxID=53419 RepID=UPI003D91E6E8